MADAVDTPEPDAGDQSVIDAILTAKDPPREPPDEDKPDGEEPDDPDAEPSEQEETEDETKDEDQDEEKKASAEDEEDVDIDELLVEITIDGQTQEVPLKDLKQNFSGIKYIEQNIQKAVEVRKAVEYNAATLYQANQQAVERLNSLNAVLDSMVAPQIDWAALKARNPTEYVLKREELRDLQDKQRLVQQEVERINDEQAALQSQARQRLVIDQAQLLAERLPDLTDAKKAPQVMARLIRAAEYFGFSKAEVETVLDHRQMLVLHAAAELLHQNEQRSQVRQKANGDASNSNPAKKILIRPGSSSNNSSANQAKRLTAEAYNRARKTGSVEDVAKTLILSAPRRR